MDWVVELLAGAFVFLLAAQAMGQATVTELAAGIAVVAGVAGVLKGFFGAAAGKLVAQSGGA